MSGVGRFEEMPRAIRWLGFAVVFFVLFAVWSTVIGPAAASWNNQADLIESKADQVRRSSELSADVDRHRDAIVGIGKVEKPGRDDPGRLALSKSILEVFGDKQTEFDLPAGGDRLREDISRGIVGPGNRLVRISGTVKFEASPEDAIAMIADLESRPEIEAIRKVTLTRGKGGKGMVDVNLVVEAWVEAPAVRRRRI